MNIRFPLTHNGVVRRFIGGALVSLLIWNDVSSAFSIRPLLPVQPSHARFSSRWHKPPVAPSYPNNVIQLVNQLRELDGKIETVDLALVETAPVVVHIKDVHRDPAAQRKIAATIQEIANRSGIDVLGLEGSSEEFDLSFLRHSPDPVFMRRAIRSMVNAGLLSGAIAAVFETNGEIRKSVGVEDDALYQKNLSAMRVALSEEKSHQKQFRTIEKTIDGLKKKYSSRSYRSVDAIVSGFFAGRLRTGPFLRYARSRLGSLPPVLALYLSMEERRAALNAGEFERETAEFASRVQNRLTPSERSQFQSMSREFRKGELSPVRFARFCLSLSARFAEGEYELPRLTELVRYDDALAAFDTHAFQPEVFFIAQRLLRATARTMEERALCDLTFRWRHTRDLASLSLTSEAWERMRVLSEPETLVPDDIVRASRSLETLGNGLKSARRFYVLAQERNDAIARSLVGHSRVQDQIDRPLVLVAGGFHSEGLSRAVVRQGYHYIGFTPSFGKEVLADSDGLKPGSNAAIFNGLAPSPMDLKAKVTIASMGLTSALQGGRQRLGGWAQLWARRCEISRLEGTVVDSKGNGEGTSTVVATRHGNTSSIQTEISGSSINVRIIRRKPGLLMRGLRRAMLIVARLLLKDKDVNTNSGEGITIRGIGLHSGENSSVRVIPREPGSGINFYHARSAFRSPIPALLAFIRPNRRRHTSLEFHGDAVWTTEHLLSAMYALNIFDADVFVDGGEIPILDGSALEYLERLRPLAQTANDRDIVRINEPIVYWRNANTVMLALPPEKDQIHPRFISVVTLADLPTGAYEYDYTHTGWESYRREIAGYPTFVESDVAPLQKIGFFRGAFFWRNIIPAYARNAFQRIRRDALARHKVLDMMGDVHMLQLSMVEPGSRMGKKVVGTFVSIGGGHRDNHLINYMVLRSCLYGQRYPPTQLEDAEGNLNELLVMGKISPDFYVRLKSLLRETGDPELLLDYSLMSGRMSVRDYIQGKLEIRKMRPGDPENEQEPGSPSAKKLNALGARFRWVDKRMEWRFFREGIDPEKDMIPMIADSRRDALYVIKRYLMRNNGEILLELWDKFLTPTFGPLEPEKIMRVEVDLWAETEGVAIFQVTFLREGEEYVYAPHLGLVMAKEFSDAQFETFYFSLTQLGGQIPEMVPRVGPLVQVGIGRKTIGIYAREWLARDFGRFAPTVARRELDGVDVPLEFDVIWTRRFGGRGVDEKKPEEKSKRRAAIARNYARMMTRVFLRFRQDPSRPELVQRASSGGEIPVNIDFSHDFMVDPLQQTMLATIRRIAPVSPDQFLFALLHTGQIREYRDPETGKLQRKEWQFFCNNLAEILQGVRDELTDTFGAVQGAHVANTWFLHYLNAVYHPSETPLADYVTDINYTFAFRHMVQETGTDRWRAVKSNPGPEIKPVVEEHVRKMAKILNSLPDDDDGAQNIWAQYPSARLHWLAFVLSKSGLGSYTFWLNRAAVTESVVFLALACVIGGSFSFWGSYAGAVCGAAVSTLIWVVSHRYVLVAGDGQSGLGYSWVPIRDHIRHKTFIRFMGIMLVFVPALIFQLDDSVLRWAVLGLATTVHEGVNPPLTAPVNGPPTLQRPANWKRFLTNA